MRAHAPCVRSVRTFLPTGSVVLRSNRCRAWLQANSWGQAGKTNNGGQALELDSATSALARFLCKGQATGSYPGNVADGQACAFPSEVVIDTNLPCDGDECEVETVRVVELYARSADGSIVETLWFEYLQLPCVELTFFGDGRHVEYGTSKKNNADWMLMCADPSTT